MSLFGSSFEQNIKQKLFQCEVSFLYVLYHTLSRSILYRLKRRRWFNKRHIFFLIILIFGRSCFDYTVYSTVAEAFEKFESSPRFACVLSPYFFVDLFDNFGPLVKVNSDNWYILVVQLELFTIVLEYY